MSRSFDGPDCGVDGCEREVGHIGDHHRVEQITPRSIDRAAFGLPTATLTVHAPAPRRIQRQRTKGWRMPEGAIYVGRPTVYGNPFPIEGEWITGAGRAFGYPTGPAFLRATSVALYRWWLTGEEPMQGLEGTTGYRVLLTEGYNGGGAAWLEGHGVIDLPPRPDVAPLRGHDLACWCPVGGWSGDLYATGALLQPCHADVLLERANVVEKPA